MVAVAESRSLWVQKNLWLEGRPFRLTKRPYLLALYDAPSQYKILMTGRQVEKTTTIGALLVEEVARRPYTSALYAASRPNYVSDFSTNRFKHFLVESPSLRGLMSGPMKVDKVEDKTLANLSKIYFRSVFLSAAKARGIPVRFLAIDEMQEMIRDHLPVIEETQSHYPEGRRIYAGTPLTLGNTLSTYYGKSTMNEWACPCTAGHWNILGMNNIGKVGPVCGRLKCDRPILSHKGQWVTTYDKSKFTKDTRPKYDGYHFNQLMVPWLQVPLTEGGTAWDRIIEKLEMYPERLFRNEVLGEPFAEGATVLSEEDMYRCCEQYRFMGERRKFPVTGNPKFIMGLDWGGVGSSSTVAAIIGQLSMGGISKPRVVDMIRMSGHKPEEEMEVIKKKALEWRVNFIAADHGNGHLNNRLLQREMPTLPVIDCHISGSTQRVLKHIKGERRYVVGRTPSMDNLFEAIRTQRIGFPVKEDIAPFVDDFTCLFEEYNPKSRVTKYEHPVDQCDDAVHALNLAYVIYQAHYGLLGDYKRSR